MRRKKVLVIEDDPDFLEGIKTSLEFAGYHVVVSEDGETGLQKAEQLKPDCIILDIILPKQDGYLVFCALKRNIMTQSIPVIILTSLLHMEGYPSADLLAKRKDIDAWIEKPMDPVKLIEKVNMLTGNLSNKD